MYIPRTNSEDRPEMLVAFMRAHPLAALVSTGPAGELWATHLPVVVDPARGPRGTIKGHVARANPHHRLVRAAAERAPEQGAAHDAAHDAAQGGASRESLVIFTGPDAYVTPAWYPGKAVHGREVPTWNYVAVHAYGVLALREDPAWLMAHLARLVDQSEAGRSAPWAVSDAPADYMAQQLKGIVGFELAITRVKGRWKMSQNRTPDEIDGVVAGLGASERPADRAVAALVEARRPQQPQAVEPAAPKAS